ncbi:MAG: monooxygenase, partial [Hamadaea sp.]|nr:monooxygenase [Hamadaea sp.]
RRSSDLAMGRPFTAKPARGTDEYRCFLLDPGLTKAGYVTGSQFLPGNAAIVHHAIVFRVPAEDVAQARALDAQSDGDGWTCFGSTGINSDQPQRQLSGGLGWIGAWAPGGGEVVLPGAVGYQMPAGSHIVLQVHYNLLGGDGADQSGLRLRLADGGAKLQALQTRLLPAPVELPCAPGENHRLCVRSEAVADVIDRFGAPAGRIVAGLPFLCSDGEPQPGPTQSCTSTVREAGRIYAAAGHMHLLGRSITIELNPGTPRAKVLLNIPVYNFDDQGARFLPQPVAVRAGDTLKVTCTHDATLRNRVPALTSQPARYVVWGDGTSDEMCLGIVSWTRA